MKSILQFLFVLALFTAGVNLLSCADVWAFRCGDGIVGIGDTKSRVLIECGKPTYKEKTGSRDVYYNDQGEKKRKKRSKAMDQWTYNCGDGDFVYVLSFEGGKLSKEETNGRGKGKSHCQGAR